MRRIIDGERLPSYADLHPIDPSPTYAGPISVDMGISFYVTLLRSVTDTYGLFQKTAESYHRLDVRLRRDPDILPFPYHYCDFSYLVMAALSRPPDSRS